MAKKVAQLIDLIENDGIAYAAEVNAFVSSFGDDKSDVMNLMLSEWKKHGFLALDELKFVLINKLSVNAPSKEKEELLHRLLKGASKKDGLTLYEDKKYVALLTGLADLYAQSTGVETYRVDGDYSNMGGTNEYFKGELEKQDGTGKRAYDGFAQTDTLFSVVAGVSYKAYKDALAEFPKAQIHAVRAGGDEIRMIVTDVPREAMLRAAQAARNAVARTVCETGIQTATNEKDSRRPGFGYADAFISMREEDGYSHTDAALRLESLVNLQKLVNAVPNLVKAELSGKRPDGIEVANSVLDAVRDTLNELATEKNSIREIEEYFGANIDMEKTKINVEREIAQQESVMTAMPSDKNFSYSLQFVEQVKNTPAYVDYVKAKQTELNANPYATTYSESAFFENADVATMTSLRNDYGSLFAQDDERLLSLIAREYENIDPATGVRMVAELPADAERYLRDAERFAKLKGLTGETMPWLAHFEFGNLAAFNKISHEHGDVVLKHYAEIIDATLKKNGLEAMAHGVYSSGGGKFKLLLPAVFETVDENGASVLKTVDRKTWTTVVKDIEKSVEKEINSVSVKSYFSARGASVDFSEVKDAKVKAFLDNKNSRIGDIESPKRETEHGVTFYAKSMRLSTKKNTLSQIRILENQAEVEIQKSREAVAARQADSTARAFQKKCQQQEQASVALKKNNKTNNAIIISQKFGKGGR